MTRSQSTLFVQLRESPTPNPECFSLFNHARYYSLGDLTSVNQSGRSRTFVYDSRKRLIAATNPEHYSASSNPALGCAGGVYASCYYYDANGNLSAKTDNRGLGVSYRYDALNRTTIKFYFNLLYTVYYPVISYIYDSAGVSNSHGRLATVYSYNSSGTLLSTTNYQNYDPLGRILGSSQTTNGKTYSLLYTYNLADAPTSETYPSGRTAITCYDGANRVSQVGCVSCGSPALTAYASSFAYAAHGAPTQYAMGNNIWHEPSYNSRLQMSGFVDLVNNSYTNELLGVGLTWNQSNNTSKNNGNLWSATYNNGIPGYTSFLTFTDTFGYDGVDRLTSATDQVTANGVTSNGWSRSFAYDAFGNMTPSGNPNPPTESFNTNNQITGLSYDQAGNQLSVNGNTLTYDFENHVVSETDGVTQAVESYVYDGDGRRVMKSGPAGTSVSVYDVLGQLAGEYGSVASMPPCLTCYLTPDHLGTPRLITDQSGNVVARHDYLPFGEEVAANTFGRNSQFGAGNDSVKQKFTGKERDSESGLDYFGARYYGSALGRWTSPDWSERPEAVPYAKLENPQTLNLYNYMTGNPLSGIDADGHDKPAEAIFYLQYPYIANQIGTCEHGSTNISTNSVRLPTSLGLQEDRQTHKGSEVNAARHTIWQATITSDLGPHGAEFAKMAGDAPEDNPNVDLSVRTFTGKDALSSADQTIDLLNNQIGRQIGQSLPAGTAPNVITWAVLDQFHASGLYTARRSADGSVSVVKTRLSDASYKAAKEKLAQLDRNGKKKEAGQ